MKKSWMQKIGEFSYDHKWVILIGFVFSMVFFGYQLPNLRIDTSNEGMVQKSNPDWKPLNEFRNQFDFSGLIVITLEPENVFTYDFLEKLQALHEELEENVPHVKAVTSLVNARRTWSEDDTLYVEELIEDLSPDTDFSSIRDKALSNPLYINSVISENGKITAIIIETLAIIHNDDGSTHYFSTIDARETLNAVYRITGSFDLTNVEIHVAGEAVAINGYDRMAEADMGKITLVSILLTIVTLVVFFRRVSGVVIPFLIAFSSLGCAICTMAIFDFPISLFTAALPSFMMAIGIADAIHILTIFYLRYGKGSDKRTALIGAMQHSALPVFLTSVTTAAGMLSFSTSELAVVGEFGITAACGAGIAFLFTITLTPALLSLLPIKQKDMIKEKKKIGKMDSLLTWVGNLSTHHPVKIAMISALLLIVSFAAITQISVKHNLMSYFPENERVKQDMLYVDDHFNGSITYELIIDTGVEKGVFDPGFLCKIEEFKRIIDDKQRFSVSIGKMFSIIDILRETNKALHDNDPEYYSIPDDRNLIAQEILLFESSGSDDLEDYADSLFRTTRITITSDWEEIFTLENFMADIESEFYRIFGDSVKMNITGIVPLSVNAIARAIRSMITSYCIAIIVITILLTIMIGGIKMGLLSMIPNLLPITLVMGAMVVFKAPMDLTSLMIGAIAIGLVVDDTLHFLFNAKKYYKQTGDWDQAIIKTLQGTGRALMITSVALALNFWGLMTADLLNNIRFGFFTGIVIVLALVADFLVTPAIIKLLARGKIRIVG